MERVFLGIGSNIGDRLKHLQSAVEFIERIPKTEIINTSSVFETEPVGFKAQAFFYNAVLEIRTELDIMQLFKRLKKIEEKIGRVETFQWGPREIDIDILYYGNSVTVTAEVIVPHPRNSERRFVLEPMNEIAPDFIDPLRKSSIRHLLEDCGRHEEVILANHKLIIKDLTGIRSDIAT